MNCPACGSPLKEHTTEKGVLFLVCSQYPKCEISGTPALLERIPQLEPRGPVKLGTFVTKLAALRIQQSKLKRAKTKEEREAIREQAKEAVK